MLNARTARRAALASLLAGTCRSADASLIFTDEVHAAHAHTSASDASGSGPADADDATGGGGGSGGTAVTATTTSPAGHWSSTGTASSGYSHTYVGTTSFTLSYGATGGAEAGVSGTPVHPGTAAAFSTMSFHATTIVGTSSTDAVRISGRLFVDSSNPMAFAMIRFKKDTSDAILLSHTITAGTLDFDVIIPLAVGESYDLVATAHAEAFGDHTVGGFPPNGAATSFEFTVTSIPAPAAPTLLALAGLLASRRRR